MGSTQFLSPALYPQNEPYAIPVNSLISFLFNRSDSLMSLIFFIYQG